MKITSKRANFSPFFLPLISILISFIIIGGFLLLLKKEVINDDFLKNFNLQYTEEDKQNTTDNISQVPETDLLINESPLEPEIEIFDKGEEIIFSNATITLLEATSGTTIEPDTYYSLPCTSESGKLVKVTINFKNTSQDTIRVSNFFLYDSTNRKFEAENSAFCLENLIPFSTKLNPGLELTYESLYELPKNAEGLKLQLSENRYVSLGF